MREKVGFYNLNVMDKMNDLKKTKDLKEVFNLN